MTLFAFDGATKLAVNDVNGKLHWLKGKVDQGAIDLNLMVSGGVNFKGGYDADTNTPDLDSTPIAITKGDMYVVTVNGTFFTEAVQVGDALIANIASAAVLTDWTILEGNDQAIKQAIKDHVVRSAANWKTADADVIANPRKFLNIFRVDRDITLVAADESSGNIEGEIWFIAQTDFQATRPKITDNKYKMKSKCAQLKWTGIDHFMHADNNDVFFEGDGGASTIYEFSNCDLSRSSNHAFLQLINDSYGNVTLNRITGTDTSATFGKIHLKQNSSGSQKAITDLNIINGCDLSGVLASADGTVGELNVYVSGSVIKNNGNGVWNATNGAVIKVFYTPDSKVDETLVAGSSAVTFTEVFKIPHAQIDLKNNFTATTDPGTSNDNTEGYIVGSTWINVTLDKVFQAVDVTTAAAVWKDLSGAAAGMANLIEDLTPQLGGNLDANGKTIDGRTVATDGTKLDGIESGATADQTDAEIETAYNAQVAAMSQATAEAGTSTTIERVTAERIKQAILKLVPVELERAISDETTDLTTGTAKITFRMPFAMTLTSVRSNCNTAPLGSDLIIDINESGSTILSTKLSIPAGAKTSVGTPTAATGTVTLDSGGSGSVDGITVNSVEIMSGAENFDTSLSQTATNVAANITANTSSPDYNASANGAVVTITAVTLGAGPNGFVVVSSTTTIVTTDVNMASGVDAAVISDSALADDAEITIDIDQIGSSTAGKGAKIVLIGTRA